MNLKGYQKLVRKLAEAKGYDQDLFYLHSRLVQESCELLDSIWQGKSAISIQEEGADVLHFFFQMLDKNKLVDIDSGMLNKLKSNQINKKKTNVKGKMVRK